MSIEAMVHTKLDQLLANASAMFGKQFVKPTVTFDLKGRAAGQARTDNVIRFNKVLLQENVDTFLETTVPHELAHILALKLFGTFAHDKYWKHVMVKLGAEPKRCHSYDTTNSRTRSVKKEYLYKCGCKTHMLTSIRHNRIQKENVAYRCASCSQKLVRV